LNKKFTPLLNPIFWVKNKKFGSAEQIFAKKNKKLTLAGAFWAFLKTNFTYTLLAASNFSFLLSTTLSQLHTHLCSSSNPVQPQK
jgi:hypothetical protein